MRNYTGNTEEDMPSLARQREPSILSPVGKAARSIVGLTIAAIITAAVQRFYAEQVEKKEVTPKLSIATQKPNVIVVPPPATPSTTPNSPRVQTQPRGFDNGNWSFPTFGIHNRSSRAPKESGGGDATNGHPKPSSPSTPAPDAAATKQNTAPSPREQSIALYQEAVQDARVKDYSAAESKLNRCLKLDDTNYEAHYALGSIRGEIKEDLDGCISHLSRAVALSPNKILYRLKLGWAYHDKGNKEAAAAQWQKVLELSPGNEAAKQGLEGLASEGSDTHK